MLFGGRSQDNLLQSFEDTGKVMYLLKGAYMRWPCELTHPPMLMRELQGLYSLKKNTILGVYTVKNSVTHYRVVVLSIKSTFHYTYRFKILSAIILAFTKIAFLGS